MTKREFLRRKIKKAINSKLMVRLDFNTDNSSKIGFVSDISLDGVILFRDCCFMKEKEYPLDDIYEITQFIESDIKVGQ